MRATTSRARRSLAPSLPVRRPSSRDARRRGDLGVRLARRAATAEWRRALRSPCRRGEDRGRPVTFEEARALFPVLESVAYLNAGTFGPLARPVAEALEAGVERDLEHGRTGKTGFEETLARREELRSAFATLV